jgi:hypothetical protein
MASTVKHLRSSTANKRPTASGLADGQLGINTASGTPGVFFKDSAGTVTKVGPAHVGSTAPNVSPAGSAGNSLGELWVNNSTTINGLNYYTGSAFVNLTPSGTTTVAGLVELATNAETQTGTDTIRAVTPSGLQSKISNSTSTTSSTTIASSTAVKAAYDLADAALPKAGGRITGNLEIGPVGSLVFEGSSDDSFETTLAVVNPTADRTITFPNVTGTVVTTGDSNTVTGTMIAATTITNAEISASAAIALSKLATGALPTGITIASGNIVDGTIINADINASAAIAGTKISPNFGSQNIQIGDKIIHDGDTNTAIRFPAADTIAFETDGAERARVDSSGRLLVGPAASSIPANGSNGGLQLHNVANANGAQLSIVKFNTDTGAGILILGKSKSATVAAGAVVADNDGLGTIVFVGDDGTDLGSSGAQISASVDGTPGANDMPGRLVFFTTADGSASPTERMRIDSAGTTTLTSAAATSPFIAKINTAEAARIDSSGRLLVGTSTAYTGAGNITHVLQLHGTTSSESSWQGTRWSNDAVAPFCNIQKSRGTSVGTRGAVLANDAVGSISFTGDDGTNFINAVSISAAVDGTPGTNDMPGRLVFSTTADGASSPTEVLRLTNDNVIAYNQPAPTSKSAAATLTIEELKTGIIQYTGSAATLTLPTGTLSEGGFSGIYTNMAFEWSVINTGSGTCTIGAGTAHTIVGGATIAAGASGRFASRRTASNTFVSYRLS